MNGEDPASAGIEAAKELLSPFFSEEMLLSKIIDVQRNTTEEGKHIYNKQDSPGRQMADIYAHFAQALEPGSIRGFKKIGGGLLGQLNERTGKPIDWQTEMVNQFTGQRISNVNIQQSIRFKWAKLDDDIGEAKRIYNTVFYSKGASPEQKEAAYQRANKAMANILKEAHEDFNAAVRLGVSLDEMYEIIEGVRINTEQEDAIVDGTEYFLEKKEEED